MLVHICCSVDSHYFLTRLKADFPDDKLVGYFYNPNIFPKSEYDLRLIDAKRSCQRLGIELYEGEYDDDRWTFEVRGLECEPEKGARCEVCFDIRFEKSAQFAKKLGIKKFTSTLLQSPLKDKEQLKTSLEKISLKHEVEFIFVDYLSGGGKEAQSRVSHEEGLYRQTYCGCVWGVINQRLGAKKPAIECFSPIDKVSLPGSSEKRTEIYSSFAKEESIEKSIKSKILNYRLLFARLTLKKVVVPSFALAYSKPSKNKWSCSAEVKKDGILYFKKESAKIITLKKFCEICKKEWGNINNLLAAAPSFEEQVAARFYISGAVYDISPIFVVDDISDTENIEFELDAVLFEDIDETKPLN